MNYRHIHVVTGGVGSWLLLDILTNRGIQLDIALSVPDVSSAIAVCRQSDMLLCYPHSVVKEVVEAGTLIAKPVPLAAFFKVVVAFNFLSSFFLPFRI
ncbi:LysR substrate binding domain protein [Vibrio thalassae]|uniref:LysR substrate binding domain protein n=2 Tax=Vibrio thalassae TaxID=1243014 RepID=A0A240ENR8_9VIBR|nr:LysR substrate binding domain protein [Vibrio thalassae]